MASDERKSSDDLIREANERLRAGQAEPEQELEDAAPESVAFASDEVPVQPSGDIERAYERTGGSGVEDLPTTPTEEQPDRRRFSPHWVRWGLIALAVGGWYLFTGLDDASRDETGEIVSAGDLDVMTLQFGDCFDDREEFEDVVVDVAAVPCSEPHDNEVFAVQTLGPSLSSGDFPGPETLQMHAYEVCSGQLFDDYVGMPYLDSSLEVFSFTPSAESWAQGDREFVCALYRLDFGKLTGTARDSRL